MPPVRILAIETSCDETAAAVVQDETQVLSSIVASQLDTHSRYGGVVPELASREHLRAIVPVVREALTAAGLTYAGLSAVAATRGPGLAGALLVGLSFAKGIAFARKLPLLAIHHLEGHIHAVLLEARQQGREVPLPALALVVSGGHTHLFEVSPDLQYRLIGQTRDDAAGEAFDKVAKLLGLPYPGGPAIDRLAPLGNPRAIRFTTPKMSGNPFDFSFSGYKTAVLRWVENAQINPEIEHRRQLLAEQPSASVDQIRAVIPQRTLDLIASFQSGIIRDLLTRSQAAAEATQAKSLIITGGVASNTALRQAAQDLPAHLPVFFPTKALSTDNAVMIAAAAFLHYHQTNYAPLTVEPSACLTLASH